MNILSGLEVSTRPALLCAGYLVFFGAYQGTLTYWFRGGTNVNNRINSKYSIVFTAPQHTNRRKGLIPCDLVTALMVIVLVVSVTGMLGCITLIIITARIENKSREQEIICDKLCG